MEYDLNRPWLTLDPWQKEYIETPPETDCFMLVPRQIGGKTTAMSIKAVEMCVHNFKEGEVVLINCLTERQAMLMLKKAQIYAEAIYPKTICKDKDNKPTMHRLLFKDGKLNKGIYCYAAGEAGDSTRGYTIKKLMVDEGSRMKEDYFVSALPTLSLTKGSMDIASTPFGKKDKDGHEKFFYKCYKDDTFKKFIVNMEDCPRRDMEMIEKMRKRLSKLQFAQEFLNCFTDELKRIFSEEWIKQVCILKQSEVILNQSAKKYLGVDVAGFGLDDCAYEGFQKITKENIEQIDHVIEKRNYTTDTSKRVLAMNEIRNYFKIGIDDGGIGFGVYSELMNNSKTKRKTEPLNNASRVLGFGDDEKPKKLLKDEMYINLLVLGENKFIKLFDNEEIKLSLESMQYDEEGKIFGSYSHITEGIIRSAWLASKDKDLNIFVHYF
jgi:hypothetical protein